MIGISLEARQGINLPATISSSEQKARNVCVREQHLLGICLHTVLWAVVQAATWFTMLPLLSAL